VSEDTIETVRVCRECGEEYRPDVLVCADCGGELEARRADEPLARPPAQEAAATGELEGYHPVFATSRAGLPPDPRRSQPLDRGRHDHLQGSARAAFVRLLDPRGVCG